MWKQYQFIIISLLILFFAGCKKKSSQSGEKGVFNALKKLEKIYREGDGIQWLKMQTQKNLKNLGSEYQQHITKNGFPPDPDLKYEPVSVIVRKNEAAVFFKRIKPEEELLYEAQQLNYENKKWKLTGEMYQSDTPIHPYAFFPPEDGAFIKSGTNWKKILYANPSETKYKKQKSNWLLKAIRDESFLYIRLNSQKNLPEPGKELKDPIKTGVPTILSPIDINISSDTNKKQFKITVQEGVTTKAKFDDTGKATENKYYLNYSFTFNSDQSDIYFNKTTNDSNTLIQLTSNIIDIKIPIASLGIDSNQKDVTVTLASNSYFIEYEVNNID